MSHQFSCKQGIPSPHYKSTRGEGEKWSHSHVLSFVSVRLGISEKNFQVSICNQSSSMLYIQGKNVNNMN